MLHNLIPSVCFLGTPYPTHCRRHIWKHPNPIESTPNRTATTTIRAAAPPTGAAAPTGETRGAAPVLAIPDAAPDGAPDAATPDEVAVGTDPLIENEYYNTVMRVK